MTMEVDSKKDQVSFLLSSVPEYIQKVECDTTRHTPPFKCAVKICTNKFLCYDDRLDYPYKFHSFPLKKRLRKIWKVKCGLNKSDCVKSLMVCSDHFSLDDYIRNYKEEFRNPNFKRKLKTDVFPNHKLGKWESQIDIEEISDTDYNSDLEPEVEVKLEWFKCETKITHVLPAVPKLPALPKEYRSSTSKAEINEELDYNEVQQEVDYNIELTLKQAKIQKELKSLKSQMTYWNKRVKKTKHKATLIKNKSTNEFKVLKKFFSNAQIELLLGRKATWTNDDLARAFTLRHMGSKKCYLYLKNKLNIPLPSLSCIQRWASSYK